MHVDPYLRSDDFLSSLPQQHQSFREKLEFLADHQIEELHRAKLSLIQKGVPFTDLSMINPDLAPPRYLLDRLFEATHQPKNHRYAVARGIRKLRSAIAHKYSNSFGVSLDPEKEICMTMGSKDASLHLLQALWEKDARILLPSPCYPAHRAAACLSDYHIDTFELTRDEDELFRRIEEKLESHSYRVIFLNFPHNPTGITVSKDFYARLADLVREQREGKTFVINDFVYAEMSLRESKDGSEERSQAELTPSLLQSDSSSSNTHDGLIEIYSMSKSYSVPGWRVGAVCGDAKVVRLLSELKAYVDYGIFLPIQFAAASALTATEDLVSELRDAYRSRCEFFIRGLRTLGWDVTAPDAGVSIWAKLPDGVPYQSSTEFCRDLLLKSNVLVMPGRIFGPRFDRFVRFALVRPEEELSHVIEQLAKYGKNE